MLLGLLAAVVSVAIVLTLWTTIFMVELAIVTAREDRIARGNDHGWIMHRPFGLWSLPPLERFGTDRRGYRLAEDVPEAKPPGTIRIAVLGGSALFGFSVASEDSIPSQIEARLRRQGALNVEVLNFGMPGYFSTNELIQIGLQVVYYEPDYVVVFDGFNDLSSEGYIRHYNHYVASYRAALDRANYGLTSVSASFRNLLGSTYSGRALLAVLRTTESSFGEMNPQNIAAQQDMRQHLKGSDPALARATYATNLRAIAGILEKFGIGYAFAMQPIHEPDVAVNTRYGVFEKTFFETCESIGATCYSFLPIFDAMDAPSLFIDVVHFTPEGNRMIGRALARLIDQDLALTRANSKRLADGRITYIRSQRGERSGDEKAHWVLVANEER